MAKKTPLTPALQTLDTDQAIEQLASGASLGDVAAAVQQQAAPAGEPATEAALGAESNPPANGMADLGDKLPFASMPAQQSAQQPSAGQDPLVAHLTSQNLELSKQVQAAVLELELTKRDLASAQVKAAENAGLLSDLTQATCAAINIANIQLNRPVSDLSHLDAQAAVAMYKAVQADFLKAFKPGQSSSSLAGVGGDDNGLGAEKAPTREEVQAAQRLGKHK